MRTAPSSAEFSGLCSVERLGSLEKRDLVGEALHTLPALRRRKLTQANLPAMSLSHPIDEGLHIITTQERAQESECIVYSFKDLNQTRNITDESSRSSADTVVIDLCGDTPTKPSRPALTEPCNPMNRALSRSLPIVFSAPENMQSDSLLEPPLRRCNSSHASCPVNVARTVDLGYEEEWKVRRTAISYRAFS
jgi:hypothetical protein